MKIENQSPITNHQPPVTNIWLSLEASHGLTAVPVNWRRHLNGQFEIFKSAFLQKQPQPSKGYPCGHCACTHEVFISEPSTIDSRPSTIESLCRCDPPTCRHDHLPLTRADVELWSLNCTKLARALCHAFGLNYQFTDLKIYDTHPRSQFLARKLRRRNCLVDQHDHFTSGRHDEFSREHPASW
jgi:hypothetical protein